MCVCVQVYLFQEAQGGIPVFAEVAEASKQTTEMFCSKCQIFCIATFCSFEYDDNRYLLQSTVPPLC